MNIGEIIERLIRKIKGEDEMGIELEIEAILSDETEIDDIVSDETEIDDIVSGEMEIEEESECDTELVQTSEDRDEEESTEGGFAADEEAIPEIKDDLLDKLKHDDDLSVEDECGILDELEDVTAEELVRDMNNLLVELRRWKI
jgi:hypothetical protein